MTNFDYIIVFILIISLIKRVKEIFYSVKIKNYDRLKANIFLLVLTILFALGLKITLALFIN